MSVTPDAEFEALAELVSGRRMLVLTGAGCSTGSGIPDYRDHSGAWKRRAPVQFQEFVTRHHARQRYWARSLAGWTSFNRADPNGTHHALAELEAGGHVHYLVTQNVDGLHRKAGSRRIVDLHGTLETVGCLECRHRVSRDEMQAMLRAGNPHWRYDSGKVAPDGDVDLDGVDFDAFHVPRCPSCAGVLKPDVVFFGESVPRPRVEFVLNRLRETDALLVVGSSLMVYSGYRFVKAAVALGKPVAAVNLGRTRADAELELKVTGPCELIMPALARRLDAKAAEVASSR